MSHCFSYSAKVRLKTDYKNSSSRADGTNALYLDVRLGQSPLDRRKLSLELSWPAKHFDKKAGICLPRRRDDNECADINLVLGQQLAQCNQIFRDYRIQNKPLTMAKFMAEFRNGMDRQDFLGYYRHKLDKRYKEREITERTFLNQQATLNRLAEFQAPLPFRDLSKDFAKRFDNWLQKEHGNSVNTRWGRHKDVGTYLHLAALDDILFVNPYDYFRKASEPGKWKPIGASSVRKLYTYYQTSPATSPERRVLQKYLASCCASFRISDLRRMQRDDIVEGHDLYELVYLPFKRRKFSRLHRMPLTDVARELIADSLRENPGPAIFFSYTEQAENRVLKRIGLKCEITERLHFHSGRETFATEFVRNGGNVAVLQGLMNHAKLATTMKYVHVDEAMKREQVHVVDKMFSS